MRAKGPLPRTAAARQARRRRDAEARDWVKNQYVPLTAIAAIRPLMPHANERDVRGVALLVYLGERQRSRRHSRIAGASSFDRATLDALFKRGRFPLLNHQHGPFEIIACARSGNTSALRTTPAVAEAVQRGLRDESIPSAMIHVVSGKRRRAIRRAIDKASLRATPQSIWRSAEFYSVARVDVGALKLLERILIHAASLNGPAQSALLAELGAPTADVEFMLSYLSAVLHRARDELAPGRGFIVCEYEQSDQGRLYEIGVGLQSAPKLIKRIALNGRWAYDVSNCHLSLIQQHAMRLGLRCPIIEEYSAAKDKTREAVADQTGLTDLEAKSSLIKLTYGSRQRVERFRDDPLTDAITEDLGREKAGRFFKNAFVQRFMRDLDRVGKPVASSWPSQGGYIINAAGCAYHGERRKAEGRKDTWSTRLAHILQGEEAVALHAMVAALAEPPEVLEHDGMTCAAKLDLGDLEARIHAQTGLTLKIERELIDLPARWGYYKTLFPLTI